MYVVLSKQNNACHIRIKVSLWISVVKPETSKNRKVGLNVIIN